MDPMKPVCDEPNTVELPIYGFEYHPEEDQTFIYVGPNTECYIKASGYIDLDTIHQIMISTNQKETK